MKRFSLAVVIAIVVNYLAAVCSGGAELQLKQTIPLSEKQHELSLLALLMVLSHRAVNTGEGILVVSAEERHELQRRRRERWN
ncbi:MAG: hypothetical protein DME86_06215 [Verrucomicrobia bacterium]|nr:MAG: hypothetical protein DME86_06215 [Verrucomicrobiota bacterium]